MKKLLKIFIVTSFLFISNKSFARLVPGLCTAETCITPTPYYTCETISGAKQTYTNRDEYEKCVQQVLLYKQEVENKEKQVIYDQRFKELSEYKDFFEKVGVNLTINTSEITFNNWLSKLKIEKAEHIQKQEYANKIEKLEQRIGELETQKNKQIIPAEKTITTNTEKEPDRFTTSRIPNKEQTNTLIKNQKSQDVETGALIGALYTRDHEIGDAGSKQLKKEVEILPLEPVVKTQENEIKKTNIFKKIITWIKLLM